MKRLIYLLVFASYFAFMSVSCTSKADKHDDTEHSHEDGDHTHDDDDHSHDHPEQEEFVVGDSTSTEEHDHDYNHEHDIDHEH